MSLECRSVVETGKHWIGSCLGDWSYESETTGVTLWEGVKQEYSLLLWEKAYTCAEKEKRPPSPHSEIKHQKAERDLQKWKENGVLLWAGGGGQLSVITKDYNMETENYLLFSDNEVSGHLPQKKF